MRALASWPDLADTWYNLARLQRQAGRFDAALASYQQALDRGVAKPEEVHLNRGVIYSDCLRQDDAAERELQAALALDPNYVPALLNLANLQRTSASRPTPARFTKKSWRCSRAATSHWRDTQACRKSCGRMIR